jgi:hypothetical protein
LPPWALYLEACVRVHGDRPVPELGAEPVKFNLAEILPR